ncbi:nitroreductase family protein [Paenibacillus xylanexedens]|uniref:nitroreductase family protein n=1 Tax=Paenibacillus xylanexedens TaxID=528191 RepID=UPI001F41CAC7|nr:nitroreductase family protein [Paenibacillus xylanexedens]MCF7754324.1 nitroreductase family protein [Paenibacillus xylanexedens]
MNLITKDFSEVLHGRRTIKKYDPNYKISREEITEMLEDAALAPSAFNLQPWRFVVIDSNKGKEDLLEIAPFNFSQINTSSAVIAVFGDLNFVDSAEEIYKETADLGYITQEIKDKMLAMVVPMYNQFSMDKKRESVLLDGGLVSMQFMLTAHAHGYATNPMSGFNKEKIAAVLGLDPERYVPILLISIGKAASDARPPVRLPISQITEWK